MRLLRLGRFAVAVAIAGGAILAGAGAAAAQGQNTVLTRNDAQKLLPQTVYYKGQTAPVQGRNSAGVKFSDGYYVLAALVDNSGYSSDVAAKYQGYFIAEVPLKVGGQELPAGIYGIGFVGDKFVVTDVGGHDVLSAGIQTDAGMKRPVPLQVTQDSGGGYRLYGGKKYVVFSR